MKGDGEEAETKNDNNLMGAGSFPKRQTQVKLSQRISRTHTDIALYQLTLLKVHISRKPDFGTGLEPRYSDMGYENLKGILTTKQNASPCRSNFICSHIPEIKMNIC